jgi:hypothetical protein
MNSGRRLAAAVLTAALSLGAIGFTAGPAEAYRDTTWPARTTPDSTSPPSMDTTWPTLDTTWPTADDAPTDTTWPTRG